MLHYGGQDGGKKVIRGVRAWIAGILLVILAGGLIWKVSTRHKQSELLPLNYSDSTVTAASEHEVTAMPETNSPTEKNASNYKITAEEYQLSAAEPWLSRSKAEDIAAKVNELHEKHPDFVGWLYMADSDIDYPVVQGTDNEYYLSHAPDGSFYRSGTLFLDWRCSKDLTDGTNIIFGHNMKQGMFGDIRSYRNNEAFDAHRYAWFVTPDKVYRIEFFALSIVSGFDILYDVPCDLNEWHDRLLEKAEYQRDVKITDKLIAFSTCASDFENARALFAGVMTELGSLEECIYPEK